MKKVIIIGDSTCDLPVEWRERLDVGFMPLPVNVGTEPRLDMYDVFPDEIFEYYKKTGTLCTTSAPNPINYVEFWNNVRRDHPDSEILHFHISSDMTITHSACVEATKEFEDIYSVDTKSVSIGVAVLIIEACRMRDEGMSAKEIYDEIERIKHRVVVSFILDSVEFLYKGGRCTGLQALGANLLGLHPVISVDNGTLKPGRKYRGALPNVHTSFLSDSLLDSNTAIENDRILIANTSFSDESNEILREQIVKLRPDLKEIIFVQPGCSICVHCGSNTVGYSYLAKEK